MPAIRSVLAALSLGILAACTGTATAPVPTTPASSADAAGSQGDAVVRVGDVTIRASAVQTAQLDAAVARRYGIARDPGTALLLVSVRQGPDASASALPAAVTATVAGLTGGREPLAMRELRIDGLIDYIGTASTTLPDTLRFEVTVVPQGGTAASLQFSRDLYPL
ncbi:DUF4426 domain-containing protein [Cognatiluteimonas weifangensis]|uniref:DUF4426 domain-containing protein n=1 Tax=Cognatiluteimonas weifangensis TaxID=2303539 RepID=A0A372DSK9_9GAMM|nr:DUF4426 domain-containing protein [Luteimonas weifangensis]RFP62454.1 DUF4426 domain-containing protein [Luteimonas weifangensis]